MPTSDRNGLPNFDPVEGASELENRLRRLYSEQDRLMVLLDQTRMELERLNHEVRRCQDEYCTDAAREEEFLDTVGRILGEHPRDVLAEIEEARKNPDPRTLEEFFAELEHLAVGLPESADGSSTQRSVPGERSVDRQASDAREPGPGQDGGGGQAFP